MGQVMSDEKKRIASTPSTSSTPSTPCDGQSEGRKDGLWVKLGRFIGMLYSHE